MLPRKTDLGHKLRMKRRAAGLGLKQLSVLLGGHPSMYILHRIETGKTNPSTQHAKLIKEFLKLPYQVIESKVRMVGLKGK